MVVTGSHPPKGACNDESAPDSLCLASYSWSPMIPWTGQALGLVACTKMVTAQGRRLPWLPCACLLQKWEEEETKMMATAEEEEEDQEEALLQAQAGRQAGGQ